MVVGGVGWGTGDLSRAAAVALVHRAEGMSEPASTTYAHLPPLMPVAAIDFRYSDPERGFDRSRVKGVVAKLTRVADPSTATALEVAAGGKLYQVRL